MLPTYQRFNTSSSGKIRSFRASEKILIFLVFISFLVIVLFGFFLLPDFGGTNGVIQVYNKFKKAGPEIFIPAPPIADRNHDGNDFDRNRLREKIRTDLDVDILEKPELQQPAKIPIVPIPVPDHHKNHHSHDKTTQDSADTLYVADGADQDPVARERRDKVKEVSLVIIHSWETHQNKHQRTVELEAQCEFQLVNSINGFLNREVGPSWIIGSSLLRFLKQVSFFLADRG